MASANFAPPERKIFTFWNGQMMVNEDPLALRRRLVQASGGRLSQLCRDASDVPPPPGDRKLTEEEEKMEAIDQLRRAEAQDNLAAVVRQAFKLPAFNPADGKGALDAECWYCLKQWWEWSEKNGRAAGS